MSKFILADEATIIDVETGNQWIYYRPRPENEEHAILAVNSTLVEYKAAETVWGWLLEHVENKPDV